MNNKFVRINNNIIKMNLIEEIDIFYDEIESNFSLVIKVDCDKEMYMLIDIFYFDDNFYEYKKILDITDKIPYHSDGEMPYLYSRLAMFEDIIETIKSKIFRELAGQMNADKSIIDLNELMETMCEVVINKDIEKIRGIENELCNQSEYVTKEKIKHSSESSNVDWEEQVHKNIANLLKILKEGKNK